MIPRMSGDRQQRLPKLDPEGEIYLPQIVISVIFLTVCVCHERRYKLARLSRESQRRPEMLNNVRGK